MRLGIDLSPFFTESKYRGIGRYARGLIEELIRVDHTDQFHFFNMYGEYQADPQLNAQCYLHSYGCGPYINDNGERLLLSDSAFETMFHAIADNFLCSSKIDAMLFLSIQENDCPLKLEWFEGVYKIGILYDLIPLIFSQEYLVCEEVKQNYLSSLEFIKRMDLLLAISETTKQDAVRLLGIPAEKIVVINAGVDPQFIAAAKEAQATLAEKICQPDAYVLFVGGTDPRKNITKAIQAFAMNRAARENNVKFVIAGRLTESDQATFSNIANEYGAAERVVSIGYVSDEQVITLYKNATALLFPSLYEGFGLPVLEAMCCGTAVITSNSSSLAEVAKGYAYLVDPNHVESISDGITKALKTCPEADEMIRAAKEHALSYHWRRVAQQAREAMQQLYAVPLPARPEVVPFSVESGMLEKIAPQYARYLVPFRWPDALSLAKELYRLEHAVLLEGNRHGTRIFYDVTVLCEWLKAGYETGIARVSIQLRQALLSYAEVIPVTLKTVRGKTVAVRIDLATRQEGTVVEMRAGDLYLMPELQIREVQVPRDYPNAQSLRERGVKTYAVVYDIMPLQMPENFEKRTVARFPAYLNEILRSYDGVLTDSKTVADDLWQYHQAHRAEIGRQSSVRVGYFHLGMDSFRVSEQSIPFSIKVMFRGAELVFMMVGTIEPRKGHTIVLQAFNKLWQDGVDCKLCILGRIGWMMDPFVQSMKQHPEFGRRLVFLEAPNDVVLDYAYQNATALIQASAGEGFGLPIIEAACNRLPVLCSDIPVFHEIAGEHALYFSRDVGSLVSCVVNFQRARRAGKVPNAARIDCSTWDEAARRVFKMMTKDQDWTHRA